MNHANRKSAPPAVCLSACFQFCSDFPARRQCATLPDLRGRSLGITGTLNASGTVLFGFVNISSFLPPGGYVITPAQPASLIINATGPTDDSALTGSSAIGTFNTIVNGVYYAGWPNPLLPLTGRFNRTTGVFSMSGTLNGLSVIDFGVRDLTSSGFGIDRVLIQFTNLGLTLTGTGSLDSAGVFTIKNPGTSSFTFTSSGTTPALSLQSPSAMTFQTAGDYPISNASFTLANTTAQAIVSGLVMLEGVPDQTKTSPSAPLGAFTFDFRSPGKTAPLFSQTTPLVVATGATQGGYALTGIPFGTYDIGIKGGKNLRVVKPGISVTGSVTVPAVTLPAGDANNDNSVDSSDFGALIGAFNTSASVSGSGYDPTVDFNFDGVVDSSDFGLLIGEFNNVGQ